MAYMHKGASQITKSITCRQACLFMYTANPGDDPPRSALSFYLLDPQDIFRSEADLAHKRRVLKAEQNQDKTLYFFDQPRRSWSRSLSRSFILHEICGFLLIERSRRSLSHPIQYCPTNF